MYFSTDELTNVEATAAQWVDKTDEEKVDDPGQFNGRAIQLYPGSNGRFGAAAADVQNGTSTSCTSSATPACSGWSTPKSNHKALFYISCGTNTKVTADQYHFSPPQPTFGDDLNYTNDDYIRSYVCDGFPNERPSWKLLGFFEEGSCSSIEDSTYDPTVCTETSSPSSKPSEHPSAHPSQSPSSMPSLSSQPSDIPSDGPSLSSQPSDAPSDQPSLSIQPSDAPSDGPSLSSQPSDTPSDGPSLSSQPSNMSSDGPSLSIQPSDAPSDGPSLSSQPSKSPSSMPSLSTQPSDMPSDGPSLPQVTASPSLSSSPSLRPTAVSSEPPSGSIDCGSFTKSRDCQSPCVWQGRSVGCTLPVATTPSPTAGGSEQPSSAPSTTGSQGTATPSVSTSPSLRPTAIPSEPPSGSISCGSFGRKACQSANGCVWGGNQSGCTPSEVTTPSPTAGGSEQPSSAPSTTGAQGTASPSVSSSPSLRPTATPSEPPSGPSTCGDNDKKTCTSPCVWDKGTCKEPDNIFAKP